MMERDTLKADTMTTTLDQLVRFLDETLQPEQVIDAIEESLENGKFFCFPGKGTRMGYLMRRFFPNYIWNFAHKAEGF